MVPTVEGPVNVWVVCGVSRRVWVCGVIYIDSVYGEDRGKAPFIVTNSFREI